ncbi:MAG: rubrerythrin family protein [Chloroflexi bacterium]|nr:rubrerythrin family protein [Chloroflexota bacterium]
MDNLHAVKTENSGQVTQTLTCATGEPFIKTALRAQRNEITEYHVYRRLSSATKHPENKKILKQIADDELKHYAFWKKRTHRSESPYTFKIQLYYLIAKFFGITFAMKLMERGENRAQLVYKQMCEIESGLDEILNEEKKHEKLLVDIIDEDHLNYVGSVLKGINVAIVELVAMLAGLTLVFHDTHLIASAGLVAGIAMAMSLMGTDYLGNKTDTLFRNRMPDSGGKYQKGPIYSGITSIVMAFFLAIPFLVLNDRFISLGFSVTVALMAIFLFNFYVSVTRDVSFLNKVREMAVISLGTAGLAFVAGHLVRAFLAGIDKIR